MVNLVGFQSAHGELGTANPPAAISMEISMAMGVPQNGWFFDGKSYGNDDWGYPQFRKSPDIAEQRICKIRGGCIDVLKDPFCQRQSPWLRRS